MVLNLLNDLGLSKENAFELRELPHNNTLLTDAVSDSYVIELPILQVVSFYHNWSSGNGIVPPALFELFGTSQRLYQSLRSRYGLLNLASLEGSDGGVPHESKYLLAGDSSLVKILLNSIDRSDVAAYVGSDEQVINAAFHFDAVPIRFEPQMENLSFGHFEQIARNYRIQWCPMFLRQNTLWIGPVLSSSVGPSWDDLVRRRVAAHLSEPIARALGQPSLNGPIILLSPNAITRAFNLLPQLKPGKMLEIGLDASVKEHTVLAWPAKLDSKRSCITSTQLISKECGVIRRIRKISHRPDLPSKMITYQADMSFTQRVTGWNCAYTCEGSSFGDENQAYYAAIGEACERYAGNTLDTLPVKHGSYNELCKQGFKVLEPNSIVLFSEEQYSRSDFPFVPFTKDLHLGWVPGNYLDTKDEVMIPAALTYSNWYSYPNGGEAPLLKCPFAGIAAGESYESAILSAIEEVIERHATMTWWLTGVTLPLLEITPQLLEQIGEIPDYQELFLTRLQNIFDFPVVCATVVNHKQQTINMGFAARVNETDAALKALLEAFSLQEGSIDLLNPEGSHWKAINEGLLPRSGLRHYRHDRKYSTEYKTDFSDCTDLMAQQQYYLDPSVHDSILRLIKSRESVRLDTVPRRTRSIGSYIEILAKRGFRPIVADLTPPDIAQTGIKVVRVIVPGTVMNSPAAFPHLGNDVVQRNAVQLRWLATGETKVHWNLRPLPHA